MQRCLNSVAYLNIETLNIAVPKAPPHSLLKEAWVSKRSVKMNTVRFRKGEFKKSVAFRKQKVAYKAAKH